LKTGKKGKKLYSSPRKIDALKRSPTAMMIYKSYLEGNQAIIFRRRRIEFSSFLQPVPQSGWKGEGPKTNPVNLVDPV